VKIHNRVLTDTEIDNDAANPKANYPETKVAYDFNESAFPSTNTVAGAPVLPLAYGNSFTATLFAPVWTNDTPTGFTNDFALAFNLDIPTNKQRINLDFTSDQLNLGANNTNYTLETWVKLATADNVLSNRMVVLRTSGAGPRVSLSINTDRKLWTTIYGNSDLKSTVIVPNDLAWHHIAVVMTNFAQAKFYLDGVLGSTINRTVATAPSTSGITNLVIGQESDALYFKGLLDRVRISNSALSISELDSIAIPLPKLAIQPSGSGSFVLTWSTNFTDYILESTESIPSVSWTGETYTVVGDQNTATIPVSTQNRFYRLRK
jgi:concanavalin A-like lectin/glucanase superfamily protein